jgi:hypothetical protein
LLFLIAVTYPPWLLHRSYLHTLSLKRDSDLLTAEINQLNEQLKDAEQQRKIPDPIANQIERLANIDWSRQSESDRRFFIEEIRRVRADMDKKLEDLIKNHEQLVSAHQQLQTKRIEMRYKLEAAAFENTTLRTILVLSLVGACCGLLLLRFGFNAWSKKVQVYQDVILRSQAEAFKNQDPPKQVVLSPDSNAD